MTTTQIKILNSIEKTGIKLVKKSEVPYIYTPKMWFIR